jgi:hypothetical protein
MGKIDVKDIKIIRNLFRNRRRKSKVPGKPFEINNTNQSSSQLYTTHTIPFSRDGSIQNEILSQNLKLLQNYQGLDMNAMANERLNNLIDNKINPNLGRIIDTQNLLYNGIGNLYNKMYNNNNVVIEDISNDDDAGNFGGNVPIFHSEKAYSPGIDETPQENYSKILPTTSYISPKASPNPYENVDDYNEDELFTNKPINSDMFKTPAKKNKVSQQEQIRNDLKKIYFEEEGGNDQTIILTTRKDTIQRARYNNLISLLKEKYKDNESKYKSIIVATRIRNGDDNKIEFLKKYI